MISYTYEKIVIASNGAITVTVFSLNTSQPGRQIIIERSFNAGASKGDIDSDITETADLVWSLQT